MEYILITETGRRGVADPVSLNIEVSQKLTEGFELYGSPGLSFDPKNGTAIYFQAMIKKTK
jgi:hypothetical protein